MVAVSPVLAEQNNDNTAGNKKDGSVEEKEEEEKTFTDTKQDAAIKVKKKVKNKKKNKKKKDVRKKDEASRIKSDRGTNDENEDGDKHEGGNIEERMTPPQHHHHHLQGSKESFDVNVNVNIGNAVSSRNNNLFLSSGDRFLESVFGRNNIKKKKNNRPLMIKIVLILCLLFFLIFVLARLLRQQEHHQLMLSENYSYNPIRCLQSTLLPGFNSKKQQLEQLSEENYGTNKDMKWWKSWMSDHLQALLRRKRIERNSNDENHDKKQEHVDYDGFNDSSSSLLIGNTCQHIPDVSINFLWKQYQYIILQWQKEEQQSKEEAARIDENIIANDDDNSDETKWELLQQQSLSFIPLLSSNDLQRGVMTYPMKNNLEWETKLLSKLSTIVSLTSSSSSSSSQAKEKYMNDDDKANVPALQLIILTSINDHDGTGQETIQTNKHIRKWSPMANALSFMLSWMFDHLILSRKKNENDGMNPSYHWVNVHVVLRVDDVNNDNERKRGNHVWRTIAQSNTRHPTGDEKLQNNNSDNHNDNQTLFWTLRNLIEQADVLVDATIPLPYCNDEYTSSTDKQILTMPHFANYLLQEKQSMVRRILLLMNDSNNGRDSSSTANETDSCLKTKIQQEQEQKPSKQRHAESASSTVTTRRSPLLILLQAEGQQQQKIRSCSKTTDTGISSTNSNIIDGTKDDGAGGVLSHSLTVRVWQRLAHWYQIPFLSITNVLSPRQMMNGNNDIYNNNLVHVDIDDDDNQQANKKEDVNNNDRRDAVVWSSSTITSSLLLSYAMLQFTLHACNNVTTEQNTKTEKRKMMVERNCNDDHRNENDGNGILRPGVADLVKYTLPPPLDSSLSIRQVSKLWKQQEQEQE